MSQDGWNVKPNTPIINGTTSGKPGLSYEYLITSLEPNGDMLYFIIDYGDGSQIEISDLCNGFLFVEHIFEEEGTYTISAKAVDILGEESNWATLEVSMPKNKAISLNVFLQRFFHRFPMFEKILNQIIL
jgi:hypothetical protein